MLPKKPSCCWYVSAGRDFRPLVFFSDLYRSANLANVPLFSPDFFLYTSLGMKIGEEDLYSLSPGEVVFNDNRTRIVVESINNLLIDRKLIDYKVDHAHIDFAIDPLPLKGYDAAWMLVRVEDPRHMGSQIWPVLYLAMENINAFEELVTKETLRVRALCATREGLGLGGCRRGIFEHVYDQRRLGQGGFDPEFVITWEDYTDALFRHAASACGKQVERLARYIPEYRGGPEHHLYRCS